VVADGQFGYNKVNMRAQRNDHGSLLTWFERMMRTLRECPGDQHRLLYARRRTHPARCARAPPDDTTGTILFLHNLGDQDATLDASSLDDIAESPTEMLADRDYGDIDLVKLTVGSYGYRWVRLRWELPP
jgi:maltose alpha-D-glucosyltransferase / alpha-amylase